MQVGVTPVYIASVNGHTEILAILLANKADINAADKVQQIKISNIYNRLTLNFKILTFHFTYNQKLCTRKHELIFNMVHVSFVCRTVLPQRM